MRTYFIEVRWKIIRANNFLQSCKCSRSGVNVRAHLLRKNFSRKLSSIQSGPISSNGCYGKMVDKRYYMKPVIAKSIYKSIFFLTKTLNVIIFYPNLPEPFY